MIVRGREKSQVRYNSQLTVTAAFHPLYTIQQRIRQHPINPHIDWGSGKGIHEYPTVPALIRGETVAAATGKRVQAGW